MGTVYRCKCGSITDNPAKLHQNPRGCLCDNVETGDPPAAEPKNSEATLTAKELYEAVKQQADEWYGGSSFESRVIKLLEEIRDRMPPKPEMREPMIPCGKAIWHEGAKRTFSCVRLQGHRGDCYIG